MSFSSIAIAGLLAAAAPVAATEQPTAHCTQPADLSATPLAAWAEADSKAHGLVPGRPATLTLKDRAGSESLTVEAAGRYGVAADSKVWIDLIAHGAPLVSVEHGHGPLCSGIRKIVWFDLQPGVYDLALSKAELSSVRLLVVRAP